MQHLYGAGLFYDVLCTVYLFNLVVSGIFIDDLIEFIEAVIVHRHSWEIPGVDDHGRSTE